VELKIKHTPLYVQLDRIRGAGRFWWFMAWLIRVLLLTAPWLIVWSWLADSVIGFDMWTLWPIPVAGIGISLAMLLHRHGPTASRRRFPQIAAATFKANGATPRMPGTYEVARDALRDVMIVSGIGTEPALWVARADGIDALVLAVNEEVRVIITDTLATALDPDEARAVFAYLLGASHAEGRVGRLLMHGEGDLHALRMLHEPRALISALLKTASLPGGPLSTQRLNKLLSHLDSAEAMAAVATELAAVLAADIGPGTRRMLGVPWRELPLPMGVRVSGWGPPTSCLQRAMLIAGASGVEGAFELEHGSAERGLDEVLTSASSRAPGAVL